MPHPDILPDMLSETEMIAETAYAKINLALHVRGRRGDGYHDLESLFVFAKHGDRLAATSDEDGAIDLSIDGPFAEGLSAGPDNLVVRAARALQSYLGQQRGAAIRLTKLLPVSSGIGGGSADAAATLRLLLRLWDIRIDGKELEGLALDLGSDVPACIGSTTRLVTGRGERLADHRVNGLGGTPMLLVNPGVDVPTGRVFAGWDGEDRGSLDAGSLDRLTSDGRNDLEKPARVLAPVIGDVLDALQRCKGQILTRMSGSGATCFALFNSRNDMDVAAHSVTARHPSWWVMQTEVRQA